MALWPIILTTENIEKSARQEHKVIIVPGLGDDGTLPVPVVRFGHRLSTAHWLLFYGLKPQIHDLLWQSKEETKFEPKLERLVTLIRRLHAEDYLVSLVGISAGGSAILNAFNECQPEVNRVVTVCSHLRMPTTEEEKLAGVKPLRETARLAPAFLESVRRIHALQKEGLPGSFLKRVMTMTAVDAFGKGTDELVPPVVSYLEGATNTKIVSKGHVLTIGKALVLAKPIADFLIHYSVYI